ncbi:hypothetical protein F0562_003197 [Nyssa sinensis]|uniref:Uncharacterized protein n=1 Tax=Nyssa sinensis TaxID=561372 RepID=A0A5J5BVD7_9ASTE|nr:hypothetical protein F0562_003197 [Nyssa sinensis]
MKRLSSSDSLGALMSICPTTEEHGHGNKHVYGREFQSMLEGLDEEGCVEESGGQIALLKEIRELKSKLHEENTENNLSVKDEIMVSESDSKIIEQSKPAVASLGGSDTTELNYESFNNSNGVMVASVFPDFKDGSSDSDSSAILNEDNSPNAAISSSGVLQNHPFMMSPGSSAIKFNCSTSSINHFQFSDAKAILGDAQKAYQPQFVKIEEHNFLSGDESCNFFSDDQAPTLHWYCPDQWN